MPGQTIRAQKGADAVYGEVVTLLKGSANDVDHCNELINLHVIAKNLQGIRSEERFQDICCRIGQMRG